MPSSFCFNLDPSNPNGRGPLGEDGSWSRFSSSLLRGCALSWSRLSHSERLSVISSFLALFRSGEGFSPQPEVTEEGWKRQGRRREIWSWTIGLWLDLSGGLCWQNEAKYEHPPLLPPLVLLFSVFLWYFLLSSPLRGSAPQAFFRLFAYEKMLKQRTEGKQGIQEGG